MRKKILIYYAYVSSFPFYENVNSLSWKFKKKKNPERLSIFFERRSLEENSDLSKGNTTWLRVNDERVKILKDLNPFRY